MDSQPEAFATWKSYQSWENNRVSLVQADIITTCNDQQQHVDKLRPCSDGQGSHDGCQSQAHEMHAQQSMTTQAAAAGGVLLQPHSADAVVHQRTCSTGDMPPLEENQQFPSALHVCTDATSTAVHDSRTAAGTAVQADSTGLKSPASLLTTRRNTPDTVASETHHSRSALWASAVSSVSGQHMLQLPPSVSTHVSPSPASLTLMSVGGPFREAVAGLANPKRRRTAVQVNMRLSASHQSLYGKYTNYQMMLV